MEYKSFNFPADLYIFILIPVKITYFRQKVNRSGYNHLLDRFKKNNFARNPNREFMAKLNKFYKASTFFLNKVLKDPNPCMIRSLVLYDCCQKNGIRAKLITGVMKNKDRLEGHSWVEINGKPFNEATEYIKNFSIVYEV